jgi:hypothetical protein
MEACAAVDSASCWRCRADPRRGVPTTGDADRFAMARWRESHTPFATDSPKPTSCCGPPGESIRWDNDKGQQTSDLWSPM